MIGVKGSTLPLWLLLLPFYVFAKIKREYAVVIDGGSSGTRVHVFTYSFPASSPWISVDLPSSQLRITPGLSSHATAPADAASSLQLLLEHARQQVPRHLQSRTPVVLLATAGLRMLPPDQAAAILLAVRRALAASGFLFRDAWAKVLPGALEGIYAWTAFNYAGGRLQIPARRNQMLRQKAFGPPRIGPNSSWGVLEMGGASMQITFMPAARLPKNYSHTLPIPGVDHPLFTQSFLGYGLDAAWFRAAMLVQQGGNNTDPCLQKGYKTEAGITGSGSFDDCVALARHLLPLTPCAFPLCSIAGHFLPVLSGDFIGVENFSYMAKLLGVGRRDATLLELAAAGRVFCSLEWADLRRRFPDLPLDYLVKTCFSASYAVTVLSSVFHVGPAERRITFSNAVREPGGREVDVHWVLGALLVEVIGVPAVSTEAPKRPLNTTVKLPAATDSGATSEATGNMTLVALVRGAHQSRGWLLSFSWQQRVILAIAGAIFMLVGSIVLCIECRRSDAADGSAAGGVAVGGVGPGGAASSQLELRASCFGGRGADGRRRAPDEAQPLTLLRSSPSRGLITARSTAGSDSGCVVPPQA